jgi:hypothetical protein
MISRAGSKSALVLMLVLIGAVVLLTLPARVSGQAQIKPNALQAEETQLYPTNDYGWLTYYMHEVFERYLHAKRSFDNGDMAMAEANLFVMDNFIRVSKGHLPDSLQNGHKFDKPGYIASMDQLLTFSGQLRANLKNKKWADVPQGTLDPMMKTCVGCHDAYKIPTDFRMDTKFKVLTHDMHEIYELYRQAGPLLQKGDWDLAKYHFMVLKPYIEEIPKNIPDTNQDGEKMDKALFMKAYTDLKAFTEEIIQKLETKSWQKGKPLPPPRIVVDNCYACHAKVAKIPSPW